MFHITDSNILYQLCNVQQFAPVIFTYPLLCRWILIFYSLPSLLLKNTFSVHTSAVSEILEPWPKRFDRSISSNVFRLRFSTTDCEDENLWNVAPGTKYLEHVNTRVDVSKQRFLILATKRKWKKKEKWDRVPSHFLLFFTNVLAVNFFTL